MPHQTPSQTVGPYFYFALLHGGDNVLVDGATLGDRIRIEGHVWDGEGQPVTDAMVEIWQANAAGRYCHPEDDQDKTLDPAFKGFGRVGTDESGTFFFETIKPGAVPGHGNELQAPHVNVTVFARGLLNHAYTRLYFDDEPLNADDSVLASIEDEARRSTLIAMRNDGEPPVYRFDIHLQGDEETVFFDV